MERSSLFLQAFYNNNCVTNCVKTVLEGFHFFHLACRAWALHAVYTPEACAYIESYTSIIIIIAVDCVT